MDPAVLASGERRLEDGSALEAVPGRRASQLSAVLGRCGLGTRRLQAEVETLPPLGWAVLLGGDGEAVAGTPPAVAGRAGSDVFPYTNERRCRDWNRLLAIRRALLGSSAASA